MRLELFSWIRARFVGRKRLLKGIPPDFLGIEEDPVDRGNAVLMSVENESMIIRLVLEAS